MCIDIHNRDTTQSANEIIFMDGTKTRQTMKRGTNHRNKRHLGALDELYLCITLRLHTVGLVSRLEETRRGKSGNRARRETVTEDVLAKIFAD